MSFLAALVHLEVFTEITLDFMLVGHTGNQLKNNLAKQYTTCNLVALMDLILGRLFSKAAIFQKTLSSNLNLLINLGTSSQNKTGQTWDIVPTRGVGV